MSVTQVQIGSLPPGAVAADSVVLFNSSDNKTTYRGTAGALAALSGPVASVQGLTGAVSLAATSVGAAPASHNHSTGDIANFGPAVVAIAATAAPVSAVNGLTGAITLNATAVGAAPSSHGHKANDVSDFSTAVVAVIGTASPVVSVNGVTGAVSLNATSVGAAQASHSHVTGDIINFATAVALIAGTTGPVTSVNGLTGAVTISGVTSEVVSINGLTGAVSLTAASVGAASASHATQHMRGGTDAYLLVMASLTALTQQEDNVALPTGDVIYISAATTNRVITGFTGGATGVAVMVINTGATYTVTIKHNHTSSATANRVLAKGATDVAVTANGHAALLVYDTGESRWRAI